MNEASDRQTPQVRLRKYNPRTGRWRELPVSRAQLGGLHRQLAAQFLPDGTPRRLLELDPCYGADLKG